MNASNQVKVKLATEISFFIAKIYLKADKAFCEVSHKTVTSLKCSLTATVKACLVTENELLMLYVQRGA